jgi:hypothetical protein
LTSSLRGPTTPTCTQKTHPAAQKCNTYSDLSYVLPFRGNAFVDTSTLTPPQSPQVLNCSDQMNGDPSDIGFDVTGCIAALTKTFGTSNWLYGFQTFHAAADALFLINQVQGALTCTWPGVNGRCIYPTYVYAIPDAFDLPVYISCSLTIRLNSYAESLGTRTANMVQLLHHYQNTDGPNTCVPGKDQITYCKGLTAACAGGV